MRTLRGVLCIALLAMGPTMPLAANAASGDIATLEKQLAAAQSELAEQRRKLDAQQTRLDALEDALLAEQRGRGEPSVTRGTPVAQDVPAQPVGEAPLEPTDRPEVAVLPESSVVSRRRRLEIDVPVEYARADRNRVIFRGIEVPQSVLVGVFDINESRQDVLTTGVLARYGVSNRLELNARIPFVYRADSSVLAPVSAQAGSAVGSRDFSVHASGLGDVEFGARYQLDLKKPGLPLFIVGLQGLAPTGSNPFSVPRDMLGNATRSATGAGFWGVTPSLTALLASDPAVLFASVGYTINFGRDIGRSIGDTLIERVSPGGEPSFSAGMAVSLNSRTSFSFGYAQTWSLGTETRTRTLDRTLPVPVYGESFTSRSRDLQLGRLLFGVSYRMRDAGTLNWNLEIGATDDAADVRTTIRVPLSRGF